MWTHCDANKIPHGRSKFWAIHREAKYPSFHAVQHPEYDKFSAGD